MPFRKPHAPCPRRPQQRGVALFVVIVFVMLSMLLALWASRTALFNEMVVGNDSDYQRAFEAAQALLQDAELDIRGQKADGSNCTVPPGVTGSAAHDICRTGSGSGMDEQIPLQPMDVLPLLAALEQKTTTQQCSKGLCLKRTGKQDFWNDIPTLKVMAQHDVGARYGQFTGAGHGESLSSGPINPLLKWSSTSTPPTDSFTTLPPQNGTAWYWIEVMQYVNPPGVIIGAPEHLLLNLTPRVVYRITALAFGRKPSTLVVLQQTYVPQRAKD